MTDRKKALGMGGVALSLLGLGLFVGNLAGCGPQRFSDGREDSWWNHGYRHAGFRAPGFVHFENHLDEKVEELKLSDSQKEQYNALKLELKTKLKTGFEKRKQFMKEIETEINKQNADLNAVAALLKQKLNEFPAMMEGYVDLFTSFYNMLDEAQQEKVLEGIREKLERHQRRFSAFEPTFKADGSRRTP